MPREVDPLVQYNALVAQRNELAGVEYADDAIRALYTDAITALDKQIAEAAVPIIDGVISDANTALTALGQLTKLENIPAAGLAERISEQRSNYAGRIQAAASFLLEHGLKDDERARTILEAAGLSGLVATQSATEVPDEVKEEVRRARQPIVPPVTLEEAMSRLRGYMESDPTITERELTPAQLWGLIMPGLEYRSYQHRRVIRSVMDSLTPEAGFTLTHNGGRSRDVVYTLGRPLAEEPTLPPPNTHPARGQASVPPAAPGDTVGNGEETIRIDDFDINVYFSPTDALLLGTFLNTFRDHLREHGIKSIDPAILAPLLSSLEDETSIRPTDEEIISRRGVTIAKIGALFQNTELLAQAMDTLDPTDVRYPLFDYLHQIIDDTSYPVLTALLTAKKEHIVTMQMYRRGGGIARIDGVLVVDGIVYTEQPSHHTKPVVDLRAVVEDAPTASATATPAKDAPATTASTPKAMPPKKATPAAPSAASTESSPSPSSPPKTGGKASRAAKATPERKPRSPAPALARSKQIIGEMLNAASRLGLDLRSSYPITSLAPLLGGQTNKIVRQASERGFLSHSNEGQSITPTDAIMAALGAHSDPTLQEYATRNKKDLRAIIEAAINNIKNK